MEIKEIGKQQGPLVVLVNLEKDEEELEEVMHKLGQQYHLIIPKMDEKQSGQEIGKLIKNKFQKKIYALGICHNKWSILNDILDNKDIQINKVIIETQKCAPGTIILEALQ